jgi:hypothetical protein
MQSSDGASRPLPWRSRTPPRRSTRSAQPPSPAQRVQPGLLCKDPACHGALRARHRALRHWTRTSTPASSSGPRGGGGSPPSPSTPLTCSIKGPSPPTSTKRSMSPPRGLRHQAAASTAHRLVHQGAGHGVHQGLDEEDNSVGGGGPGTVAQDQCRRFCELAS